jgi:hypothetical protein
MDGSLIAYFNNLTKSPYTYNIPSKTNFIGKTRHPTPYQAQLQSFFTSTLIHPPNRLADGHVERFIAYLNCLRYYGGHK